MNRLNRSGAAGRPSMAPQTLQVSPGEPPSRSGTVGNSFFLPARYEENYRYPLLVWLHQDGGSDRQVAEVLPHISTQNFVAVGVQGSRAADATGQRYEWLDSPLGTAIAEESIFAAIDAASGRYSINAERIYLAGYREGGTMALRVALRNAERVDGVVTIDSPLPRGGRPLADLAKARELAIFSAVALEGRRYPTSAVCQDLRLWHAASLRMEMRQYTVDDCMVTEVLSDVNKWVMARVTGQSAQGALGREETVPVAFSAN